MGFEPTTASLEGWNSTTELRPQYLISFLSIAQELRSHHKHMKISTQILRPYDIDHNHRSAILVGRQGFEPWKPMAADLQSAPVDHLGTCPFDQVGLLSTKTVFELHHGNQMKIDVT